MNKVLEKATGHFRSKLTAPMSKIRVDEWDCDIWFKSVNTLKEESRLVELAQQGKTIEALVETLIIKARNEDGSKMFNNMDKVVFLNEIDPNIVIRIVSEMNTISAVPPMDELEKN